MGSPTVNGMEALAQSRREFAANGDELFFVDMSLPDAETLIAGLGDGSKVYALESSSNVFGQIEAALAGQANPVRALHLYGYGRPGAINLGGQWLDEAALSESAAILARIGASLAKNADILLYGCNTGAGLPGMSFITTFATLTGTDVAASSDITGQGGDWELESSVGVIETRPVIPDRWFGRLDQPEQSAASEPEADAIPGGWNGILDADHAKWGIIEGTEGADILTGFVTNDVFISNGGADQLAGGRGDDVYYISGPEAEETLIVEKRGEGTDTVVSQVKNYNLAKTNADQEIEYIILDARAGSVARSAMGNNNDNTIVGNAQDNMLLGGARGNDYLDGGDGRDYLDGGDGRLTLADLAAEERQSHPDGAGILFNNGQSDTLRGGAGDDQYIVRNARDVVIEGAGQGKDHVFSFVDHTLSANVENLTLLEEGVGRLARGNNLNNVLVGSNRGDTRPGGAGAVTIDGGAGADTMIGGYGDDLFYVDNVNDVVRGRPDWEKPADFEREGRDTIVSSVTLDLNAKLADGSLRYRDISEVSLTGAAKLNITAYSPSDGMTLRGNAGANLIKGSDGVSSDPFSGADYIIGGAGNDTIYAGKGNDTIVADGGNDLIYTGQGSDVVTLAPGAAGSSITVQDFDAASDFINDSAFASWKRTIAQSRANTVITYTNPKNSRQKVTLTLVNTRYNTVRFGSTAFANSDFDAAAQDAGAVWEITALGTGIAVKGGRNNDLLVNKGGANRLDGGAGNDIIRGKGGDTLLAGSGTDSIEVDGFGSRTEIQGGEGSTAINIKSLGGSGDATIDGGSASTTLSFTGANPVHITYDEDGNLSGISQTVQVDGESRETTINVSSSNIARINGTSGADSVDAAATGSRSENLRAVGGTVSYYTNGGNDTFEGGAAAERLYLHALDAASALVLNGGGGSAATADMLVFDPGQAVSVELKGKDGVADAVTRLKVGGSQLVPGTSICGFEHFVFGRNNDYFELGAVAADTILAHASLTVDMGAGNDIVTIGRISPQTGSTQLNLLGGADYDILRFNSGAAMNMTLNASGDVSALDFGAGAVRASITGFEEFDGSGNSASTINASALTLAARSLKLTGSDGEDNFTLGRVNSGGTAAFYGGGGSDELNVRRVETGGKVTLDGGAGDDRLSLGYLGTNAAITVSGGAGSDTLDFGAASAADHIGMILDASGNLVISRDSKKPNFKMGGRTISLISTGVSGFSGGFGNDTLDARAVTRAVNGELTLAGGAGNDILYGSNTLGTVFQTSQGNDKIYGGKGADTIELGSPDSGGNSGSKDITTGAGADVIRVRANANGSIHTIRDFQSGVDKLEDADLLNQGWLRSEAALQKGNAASGNKNYLRVTYSRGEGANRVQFHLDFVNLVTAPLQKAFKDLYPPSAAITPGTEFDGRNMPSGTRVLLYGTAEADTIYAPHGGSTIYGNGGGDLIHGGDGQDFLYARDVNDYLAGGAGDDSLEFGNLGIEGGIGSRENPVTIADGGKGNDTIRVGDIDDNVYVKLTGGPGGGQMPDGIDFDDNDKFYIGHTNFQNVVIEGGRGNDSVYLTSSRDYNIVLRNPGIASDVSNMQAVYYFEGGSGNDVIDASLYQPSGNTPEYETAGKWRFILDGGAGNDRLTGAKYHQLNGGAGDDTLVFSGFSYGGTATVNGGAGKDELWLQEFGDPAAIGAPMPDQQSVKYTIFSENRTSGGTAVRLKIGDDLSQPQPQADAFPSPLDISGHAMPGVDASEAPKITLEDTPEVIRLNQNARNDVSIKTVLNTNIVFGSYGGDLTFSDAAAGSVITVSGWLPGGKINAPQGYTAAASFVDREDGGKDTRYEFVNGAKKITVTLAGVMDPRFAANGVTMNVRSGESVHGGTGGDIFNVTLSDTSPLELYTGGAPGYSPATGTYLRDIVNLSVTGFSSPGTGTNLIVGSGEYARMFFENRLEGGNGVIANFGTHTSDTGEKQAELQSLQMKVGDEASSVASATLSAYGFTRFCGTSGDDYINASQVEAAATWADGTIRFGYQTNGGSDTYVGSVDGTDYVRVNTTRGSESAINKDTHMDIDGGSGSGQDILRFDEGDNQAVTKLYLAGNGDVDSVIYNGITLSQSRFTNFETYHLGEYNDTVDVSLFLQPSSQGNSQTINVFGYGGADSFSAKTLEEGKDYLEAGRDLNLSGGDGKDIFDFGKVLNKSGQQNSIRIQGDADADTYRLRADGMLLNIVAFLHDGADTFAIQNAAPLPGKAFDPSQLCFQLVNTPGSGPALYVWNADGTGKIDSKGDNRLKIHLQNNGGDNWNKALTDDVMEFWSGAQGVGTALAKLDLQTVLDVVKNTPNMNVRLKYEKNRTTGLYKAISVVESRTPQNIISSGDGEVKGTAASEIFNVVLGGQGKGKGNLFLDCGGAFGSEDGGCFSGLDEVYLSVVQNGATPSTIRSGVRDYGFLGSATLYFVSESSQGITATFGNVFDDLEDPSGYHEEYIGLTSLQATTKTGITASADVKAYGFDRFEGTMGDDVINAQGVTAPIDSRQGRLWLRYQTNGGSDTYYGSDYDDYVEVYMKKDASGKFNIDEETAMHLDGGGGDHDSLNFYNGESGGIRIDLTLAANGDLREVVYNGAKLTKSEFINFENYGTQNLGDLIDISDYVSATNASAGQKTISINSGYGNDTIRASGDVNPYARISIYTSFDDDDGSSYGWTEDDVFEIGKTVVSAADVAAQGEFYNGQLGYLNGGAGNDTYRLQAAGHRLFVADTRGLNRIEFLGATGAGGGSFDLSQLCFSYDVSGYFAELKIWNVDGLGNIYNAGTNFLKLAAPKSGDKLAFYTVDAKGAAAQIGKDVDLGSIADVIQSNGKIGENVRLNFVNGKAAGVAADATKNIRPGDDPYDNSELNASKFLISVGGAKPVVADCTSATPQQGARTEVGLKVVADSTAENIIKVRKSSSYSDYYTLQLINGTAGSNGVTATIGLKEISDGFYSGQIPVLQSLRNGTQANNNLGTQASMQAYGFQVLRGTAGDDCIEFNRPAGQQSGMADWRGYETGGGSDTYRGGEASDSVMIDATNLTGNSRLEINGKFFTQDDNNNLYQDFRQDYVSFEQTSKKLDAVVNANGDIASLKVGGQKLASAEISNFDIISLGQGDDQLNLSSLVNRTAAAAGSKKYDTGDGADTILATGEIDSSRSVTISDGNGNDVMVFGRTVNDARDGVSLNMECGSGADVYWLNAKGHSITSSYTMNYDIEPQPDMDVFSFYGVSATTAGFEAYLNSLRFSLINVYNGVYSAEALKIWNIDGQEGGKSWDYDLQGAASNPEAPSNVLTFQAPYLSPGADTNNFMRFYGGSADSSPTLADLKARQQIGGDVDLQSIVDAMANYKNSGSQNLTFTQNEDGIWRAKTNQA